MNTSLPLSLYDKDIMAVYLKNYTTYSQEALILLLGIEHGNASKKTIPTKDPCKYMCIYNS